MGIEGSRARQTGLTHSNYPEWERLHFMQLCLIWKLFICFFLAQDPVPALDPLRGVVWLSENGSRSWPTGTKNATTDLIKGNMNFPNANLSTHMHESWWQNTQHLVYKMLHWSTTVHKLSGEESNDQKKKSTNWVVCSIPHHFKFKYKIDFGVYMNDINNFDCILNRKNIHIYIVPQINLLRWVYLALQFLFLR